MNVKFSRFDDENDTGQLLLIGRSDGILQIYDLEMINWTLNYIFNFFNFFVIIVIKYKYFIYSLF